MISTSSLPAFSGIAAPSFRATVDRTGQAGAAVLARAQPDAAPRQATGSALSLPEIRPSLPPPRGTLLNRTA